MGYNEATRVRVPGTKGFSYSRLVLRGAKLVMRPTARWDSFLIARSEEKFQSRDRTRKKEE